LTGRKQQIKLQGVVSGWQIIQKGVQVSIMGPLLFNIFINDIFYFIEHGILYNYAVDTLSYADRHYNTLINVLEKESSILIERFNFNCMQANPDKFQAIAVGFLSKKIF
jgi:hypothetical protein